LVSAVVALTLLSLAPAAGASGNIVGQSLQQEVESSSGTTEVLVNIEDSPDATTPKELKVRARLSQQDIVEYAESTDGVRVLNTFWIANAVLLEVDADHEIGNLAKVADVKSLRTNAQLEVMGASATDTRSLGRTLPTTTTDAALSTTNTSLPYGVRQINAPEVWSDYGTKGDGVKVAVLDSGVNVSHPDIDLYTTNASDPTYPGGWAEFDADGNRVDSEPHDSEGHGTHISGTVAGEKTGVAPRVDLMHGLVVDGGTGRLSQVLSGLEWAVNNDADVISLSIGGRSQDAWIDAVENTNEAGTVVVSSAGNSGTGTSTSPGNVYNSVSVGAVDSNLNVAYFSSGETIDTDSEWGTSALGGWPDEYVVPDVVAAGVDVNSTSADGGYEMKSGTSMATPHLAGAVALAISASGSTHLEEARHAFALTPHGSGSEGVGTRYGHGVADAVAATEFLLDDAGVSGTVVDESGSPVTDAQLRVDGAYVKTNGGDYDVRLSEGDWRLEATAPGYDEASKTVSLPEGQNAETDLVIQEVEPSSFGVNGLDGPSDAETGGRINVTATVENTGDERGTQNVSLRLAAGGDALDRGTVVETEEDITLNPGESEVVAFTTGAPDDEGSYDYGVFSDNSSETGTVTVEAPPPFFEVTNLSAPTGAEADGIMTVSANVTNTGGTDGEQEVTYRLSQYLSVSSQGRVVASTNVTLEKGNLTTVSFTVRSPESEGEYEHGVFTHNTSVTRNFTVLSQREARLKGYRGSGGVDLAGLQDAIQDFVDDEIDLGLLQDVIQEFVET